jgi:hypothetical protein
MATLAASRKSVSDNLKTLEEMSVGSATIINGFTISHEGEGSFHMRMANEAMFGSARSVAEWMELVKKEI